MTPPSISLLWFWFTSALLLSQPCVAPLRGLAVAYSFDEPLFASLPHVTGVSGPAVQFDGKSTFAELPAAPFNPGEENFSVEIWVRTRAGNVIRNFADKRSSLPSGWLLYIRSGLAGFQVVHGSELTDAVATRIRIDDGQWHHLVGVARRLPPQAPELYIDGKLAAKSGRTITLANLDSSAPLWLARHHANTYVPRDNLYLATDLDELAFYRRALDPAEIGALYRQSRLGKCRK